MLINGFNVYPKLFNTEMVKAIKRGDKTVTRRLVTDSNSDCEMPLYRLDMNRRVYQNPISDVLSGIKLYETGTDLLWRVNHKHDVGDYIYVKETHTIMEPEHCNGFHDRILYKADVDAEEEAILKEHISDGYPYQWKPSIFMKFDYARIFLRYKSIRAERLRDITAESAIAEGILKLDDNGIYKDYSKKALSLKFEGKNVKVQKPLTPISSYSSLWDSINAQPKPIYAGKEIVEYVSYPWAGRDHVSEYKGKPYYVHANPLVWVEEFEVVSLNGLPGVLKTKK